MIICDKCNYSSESSHNFNRHICREKTNFKCITCLMYYKNIESLNKHKRTVCKKETKKEAKKKEVEKLKEEIEKLKLKEEIEKLKLKEEIERLKQNINNNINNNEIQKSYKGLPKKIRTELWLTNYGASLEGVCFVCNTKVNTTNYEAGHIISRFHGGSDLLDNLKIVCRGCNSDMSTENMILYRNKVHNNIYDSDYELL